MADLTPFNSPLDIKGEGLEAVHLTSLLALEPGTQRH